MSLLLVMTCLFSIFAIPSQYPRGVKGEQLPSEKEDVWWRLGAGGGYVMDSVRLDLPELMVSCSAVHCAGRSHFQVSPFPFPRISEISAFV